MTNKYLYNGKVVTASSKREAIRIITSSTWSKQELEELGMSEKELKQLSDKSIKETFEIS